MSYKRRRTLARVAFLTATSFYLSLFPWAGTAEARFTTLQAITRQITPANMLIVLDTSGSMVALPGGLYQTSNEVGMDCDSGQNCKPVASAATCYDSTGTTQVSPVQYCSSNAECQIGKCTDGEPCKTTSDCVQPGSTCSGDGSPCTTNADCDPTPGYCLLTGGPCSSAAPCPAASCTQSGASCNPSTTTICSPQKCISDPNVTCTANAAGDDANTLSTCSGALYDVSGYLSLWGGTLSGTSFQDDTGPYDGTIYGNLMNVTPMPSDNFFGTPAAGSRTSFYNFKNFHRNNSAGTTASFQVPDDDGGYAVVPVAQGSTMDNALSGDFTLGGWIYRTRKLSSWVSEWLINRRDPCGSGVYESFGLTFNSNDTLMFINSSPHCTGGTDDTLQTLVPFPTGKWIHIAVTYDHSYLRLYQDGTEIGNMPYNKQLATSSEPLTFGAQLDRYYGTGSTLSGTGGYLGCYKDYVGSVRDLPALPTGAAYSASRTPANCISACKAAGFNYAGLQDSGNCFCGWKYGSQGTSTACSTQCASNSDTTGTCWKTCTGDATKPCGGYSVNQIYDTGLGSHYVGCFADQDPAYGGGARDLTVKAYDEDATATIESCILTCAGTPPAGRTAPAGAPFIYAAVQSGGECWCGNSFGKYGFATGQTFSGTAQNCDKACNNNTSTTETAPYCGGAWANSVYSIASVNKAITGNNVAVTSQKFFRGAYDSVKIWPRALTASEVKGLVNKCDPNTCAPASGNSCCQIGTNCTAVTTNTCGAATTTNTCTLTTTNICKITNNTSTPPKMCRQGQTRCVLDSDCSSKIAGDTCGPASSRMAIAKRVLKDIIAKNEKLLNFGLMTYKQGNYFPYYSSGTATTTATATKFFYKSQLVNFGKYDDKTGPATTFTRNGVTYTLEDSTDNTQKSNYYMARTSYTTYEFVAKYSQPWCGLYCTVTDPGNQTHQGVYVGSVYSYTLTTSSAGATVNRGCSYTDKTITTLTPATYTTGTTDFAACGSTSTTGTYTYFTPRTDYQSTNTSPPISVQDSQCWNSNSSAVCNKNCGGRWDAQLSPIIDTASGQPNAATNNAAITRNLEWATYGGLVAYGSTPIGCSLYNDGSTLGTKPELYSAYHYMATVKHGSTALGSTLQVGSPAAAVPADPISCRTNAVLLVTDGEANGPADNNCGSAACAAANPISAGCTCKAVLSAYKLRWQRPTSPFTVPSADGAATSNALGAKTYVIGFAADVKSSASKTTLDNIARAGGTPAAYTAVTEQELTNAIQNAIFQVIAGSYSTGQASSSAGAQSNASGFSTGTMLLDARADFPSWKGHLIAYETTDATKCPGGTGPVPCLLWDTAAVTFSDANLDAAVDATKPYLSWKSRRIYTSSGKTLVALNDGTGNVPTANVTTLFNAGLGATSTEVNTIAQWMMGITNSTICSIGGTTCSVDTDCSSKITGDTCGKAINPAPLGTFVNSTPIGVGPPGISALPGGQDFYNKYRNRPELIYVAADDGMLHAFFSRDTTLGSASFKGGSEAFAYIPPQMLRTITNLYAQGGQFPHPDDHIYGISASAKVKNICVANCTSTATPSTADWRTVLVLGEGQGGNDVVMLDVTNPFTGSGTNPFVANGISSTPVGVLWNTADLNALPAAPNATLQSSYDTKLGQTLSVPGFAIGKTSGTTYDDYRVVFASGYAQGGYTSYTPTVANQGLTIVSVKAADGTMLDSQPPATTTTNCSSAERTMLTDVAIAKNNQYGEQGQIVAGFYGDTWGDLWQYVPGVGTGGSTSTTGTVSKIFSFGCQAPLHFSPTTVQLDRDNPGNYANNIFLAQVTNSALDKDSQGFGQSALGIMKLLYTGSAVTWDGTWILDPGNAGQVTNICADTSVSPCTKLSSGARPTSTPIAILKADGSGFELFSAWYVPPPNGCTFGATYLTVHEVQGGGLVVQKLGRKLADQQVTNVVLVGGKAMFLDRNAALQDVTGYLPFTVGDGKAASNPTAGERFKRLGWSELP